MKFRLPGSLTTRRPAANRAATRRPAREEGTGTPPPATPTGEGQSALLGNFHLRSLKCAWRPFSEKSLSHWTTTVVIALALTIYGTFYLLLVNANAALSKWENDNSITVFMQRNADRNMLLGVGKMVKSRAGVTELLFISPKEALTRLKGMMGEEAALLDELEENPLPYSLEFKLMGQNRAQAAALAKEIGGLPGVETVSYDHQWADRLGSLVRVIRYIGNVLSLMLLAAVALIVSNTIKLTIIARRDEVEIMRFLGADDAFIKTPFIYEGVLQGLLGACGALLLTGLLYLGAHEVILDLGRSFGTNLQLEFLPVSQLALLVIIGGALGLSGAFISLSRFLEV
ncbi:MAG: ABC transporter permease [Magnetococcales bacterium]|nr:ABC transporter permease [Magnetococcales bacterium]